jgi:hypothetical protein
MGITISATGGAGTNTFNVKGKGGGVEAVTFERAQMIDEVEDGEKPVVIEGYSDPFDLTSEQWGTSTMIRLLFRIGPGHEQEGGIFSVMFGFKAGPKARLREVLVAAMQRDLRAGEDIDLDGIIGARLIVATRGEVNTQGLMITKFVAARPVKAKASKSANIWGDE